MKTKKIIYAILFICSSFLWSDDFDNSINIHNPNCTNCYEPIADAGVSKTYFKGGLVTLDGTNSYDPDGGDLTYLWTAPNGIVLDDVTASMPTFTAPDVVANTDYEIELVSDNNYFIFQPLLPEVASGTIYSSDAVTPIRQMLKGIKYRNAEIASIDFNNKKVSILQGFKKSSHLISYDHLVIALGQVSNLDIVKGLKDHAFTMRSLQDAYDLRNHILGCLELADVTTNKDLRKRLLNNSFFAKKLGLLVILAATIAGSIFEMWFETIITGPSNGIFSFPEILMSEKTDNVCLKEKLHIENIH